MSNVNQEVRSVAQAACTNAGKDVRGCYVQPVHSLHILNFLDYKTVTVITREELKL